MSRQIVRICLWVIVLCSPAESATIIVKADGTGDYATIQAAIDAADPGDEVVLEPGIYTGDGNRDIDFRGKAITVRSTDPDDPAVVAATMIDCEASDTDRHRGFFFHTGEDDQSVLAGVSIVNGYADNGGGIYCYVGSSPTIINCTISQCSAAQDGGALYLSSSSSTIGSCRLTGNQAAGHGGGIYCADSSAIIRDCIITENVAGSTGGGIKCENSSGTVVTRCTVSNNRASNGGGIACGGHGATATISHCRIANNIADAGGGLSYWGVTLTIEYCLISGNKARVEAGPSLGGGVIRNCTIINNWALRYGGGFMPSNNPEPVTMINSIVWGNRPDQYNGSGTVVRYTDVQGGYPGEGNIELDPLLTLDGHLRADSPCRDAGDPSYTPPPGETDIDGDPGGHGGRVDMGADEFVDADGDGLPDWWELRYFGSETAADPALNPDGDDLSNSEEYEQSRDPLQAPINYYVNPTEGNDAWDGLADVWDGVHGPKATIQAAIDAAAGSESDQIILAPGTYTGPGNRDLDFKGKKIIVRSVDPHDPAIVAATVIDCQGSETEPHRAFHFHSQESLASVLSGITIRNGYAQDGGAVYVSDFSAATVTQTERFLGCQEVRFQLGA